MKTHVGGERLENSRGFQATGSSISPTRCNYILFNENCFLPSVRSTFGIVVRIVQLSIVVDLLPSKMYTSVVQPREDFFFFFSFFKANIIVKMSKNRISFSFVALYTRIDRFHDQSLGNDSFGIYRLRIVDWVKFLLQIMNQIVFFFHISLFIFGKIWFEKKILITNNCKHLTYYDVQGLIDFVFNKPTNIKFY